MQRQLRAIMNMEERMMMLECDMERAERENEERKMLQRRGEMAMRCSRLIMLERQMGRAEKEREEERRLERIFEIRERLMMLERYEEHTDELDERQ